MERAKPKYEPPQIMPVSELAISVGVGSVCGGGQGGYDKACDFGDGGYTPTS
jgi:hypothetical protein